MSLEKFLQCWCPLLCSFMCYHLLYVLSSFHFFSTPLLCYLNYLNSVLGPLVSAIIPVDLYLVWFGPYGYLNRQLSQPWWLGYVLQKWRYCVGGGSVITSVAGVRALHGLKRGQFSFGSFDRNLNSNPYGRYTVPPTPHPQCALHPPAEPLLRSTYLWRASTLHTVPPFPQWITYSMREHAFRLSHLSRGCAGWLKPLMIPNKNDPYNVHKRPVRQGRVPRFCVI